MRIISDFHDYYDVGMQNGVDPQLPYKRFRREEECWVGLWKGNIGHYQYCTSTYFIGFAGKVYPAVQYNTTLEGLPDYYYDIDRIDESFFRELIESRWPWPMRRKINKDDKHLASQIRKEFRTFFENEKQGLLLNLFKKFETAVFVYKLGEKKNIINERLSSFRFQKVLPPIPAYQELAMYVGSYLTKPVIEEPPISDKIKAEIHGFDQFSFRKDKNG